MFIFPWPVSRECIPQEPGRIEYYNQLFCLRGHLESVSEIQTSLDVSDLYVIKGREELTSCSSLIHSHMFPLLDILYRQVGNLSFGKWRLPNFVMAASNHIVTAIQGAGNTTTSAWDSELIYLSDLSYQRRQAIYALSQLSTPGQGLSDWPVSTNIRHPHIVGIPDKK